jgi:hypothetical protein
LIVAARSEIDRAVEQTRLENARLDRDSLVNDIGGSFSEDDPLAIIPDNADEAWDEADRLSDKFGAQDERAVRMRSIAERFDRLN